MYVQFFLIVKIDTATILSIFFALNSWIIFHHYIDGKTVTSSSILINPKGKQVMPAIIICREMAYDTVRSMARVDDFLYNTMKLIYHLDDEEGNPVEANSTYLKSSSVYSLTRVHCYILQYTKEVKPPL